MATRVPRTWCPRQIRQRGWALPGHIDTNGSPSVTAGRLAPPQMGWRNHTFMVSAFRPRLAIANVNGPGSRPKGGLGGNLRWRRCEAEAVSNVVGGSDVVVFAAGEHA